MRRLALPVLLLPVLLVSGCGWLSSLIDDLVHPDPVASPLLVDAGTWHWQGIGDLHGTSSVVGNPILEGVEVQRMLDWGIARHYGSYGDRPVTDAATIGAWNGKLHGFGITSELLLGDPGDIDPALRPSLIAKVQTRLIAFHAARPWSQHFDAIHLDIEPQAAADWGTITPADRYQRLLELADTYAEVRKTLNVAGETPVEVHVDLPVWFDDLPPALGGTGSVGWPSVADRDAWFTRLPAVGVTTVTWMAYQRPTAAQVLSATAWETAHTPVFSILGVDRDTSVGLTTSALFSLASTLGASGWRVDLHDFADLAANP